MRKFLVVIAVIFLFICGITKTNAADKTVISKTAANIEAVENSACQPYSNNADEYFICTNITGSYQYMFSPEGFGFTGNNIFELKNLFISDKNNLKLYNYLDGYLLSFSSNPRAP